MIVTPHHSSWVSAESMELLIKAGANVNAQNRIAQTTPLHCAIRGTFQSFKDTHPRRVKCAKLLLENGADGKLCDVRGKDAFEFIDDVILEAKVRRVGDIEEEMKEMREALEGAGLMKSQLVQSIDALDTKGVKDCLCRGEEDEKSKSKALLAAVEKFKVLVDERSCNVGSYDSLKDIIHALLDVGADSNARPTNALSLVEAPLHIITSCICSAYSGAPKSESLPADVAGEIIHDLIAHGAGFFGQIDAVTSALLPSSAHKGKIEAVKFLTKTVGVDPNFCGRQGMTALHLAARSGKIDVVKFLLTIGSIDLSIADDAGKMAIDYARANGKDEIVALLLGEAN